MKLSDIADRLRSQIPNTTCCTSLQRNFLADFGKVFPAVWVRSKRWTQTGGEFTGQYTQHGVLDVSITLVVARYTSGIQDCETDLEALRNKVFIALSNWQHQDIDRPFYVVSYLDGPEAESVALTNIIFRCESTIPEE